MTATLFIGGCADGEWIYVPADQGYWGVTRPVGKKPDTLDALLRVYETTSSAYRSEWFTIDRRDIRIFVDQRITVLEAFNRLLENYRPKP